MQVIETWEKYYKTLNANVHRGIHTLSQLATEEMELARKFKNSLMQKKIMEVVFTRGTTSELILSPMLPSISSNQMMKLLFPT